MKILWFASLPILTASEFDIKKEYAGANWIGELAEIMLAEDNVELAIGFINKKVKKLEVNKIGGITYYSIPFASSKIQRWSNRVFSRIEGKGELALYRSILDDYSPDLIQVFGTENNFGRVQEITEVPVIIHLQGILSEVMIHWYDGITKREVSRYTSLFDKIKGFSYNLRYQQVKKKAAREKQILADAKYLLGRTAWDKEISTILAPKAQYHHCDEVLRKEFYSVHWSKPVNSKISLVSLFNPEIYKGLETVMHCSDILNEKNIEFNWNIIGLDPNNRLYRIFLRAMGLNPSKLNINMLGKLDATQIIEIFKNSDIFIHCSHVDNSPNGICEAMISGIPVIASNVGGISSLIKNGENGLLFQSKDFFHLSGLIISLSKNKSLSREISRNAKMNAQIRHNRENIQNRLLGIYEKVLALHSQ